MFLWAYRLLLVVVDKEMLVADGGKLSVLDSLLSRLKAEHHRVLIYSQMTRMIDILEVRDWRFGVAVALFVAWTKLLYVGPG